MYCMPLDSKVNVSFCFCLSPTFIPLDILVSNEVSDASDLYCSLRMIHSSPTYT